MRNTSTIQNNYMRAEWESKSFKPIHQLKEFGTALVSRLFTAKKQLALMEQEANKTEQEIIRLKWELLQKNELVKNISFHQSHSVRRPLANILGIIELMNSHKDKMADAEVQEMISLLKISADDLDKSIKHNSAVGNL